MNKCSITLLLLLIFQTINAQELLDQYGALIRSDTLQKNSYLCFTGHDYDEGFKHVVTVLKKQKVKASFFLTGDFIRNHRKLVKRIAKQGHYIGAHSDKHLLYCDWVKRDSLLHNPEIIKKDIVDNLHELESLGIKADYFMPPYEWYNAEVVAIAKELKQTTVNFSFGTKSNADYTTPDMPNYTSSDTILKSIYDYEKKNGMNGFHFLLHPGTNPLRKDKLYLHLNDIIMYLKEKGYQFSKF